jgi:hypothetical protein
MYPDTFLLGDRWREWVDPPPAAAAAYAPPTPRPTGRRPARARPGEPAPLDPTKYRPGGKFGAMFNRGSVPATPDG